MVSQLIVVKILSNMCEYVLLFIMFTKKKTILQGIILWKIQTQLTYLCNSFVCNFTCTVKSVSQAVEDDLISNHLNTVIHLL